MRIYAIWGLILLTVVLSQAQDRTVLSFSTYLAEVRANHPQYAQTKLLEQKAKVKLLKARGALDPKLTTDWELKQFQGKNYYNLVESKLKIPSITGIEFQLGYNYASGTYYNPEDELPEAGQATLGLRLPILQGFLKNPYRTGILQAQTYQAIAKAETVIAQNDFLYQAAVSYWTWCLAYNRQVIVQAAIEISKAQLDANRTAFFAGDIAAIDTLKAYTEWQTMRLELYEVELELKQIGNQLQFFAPNTDSESSIPEALENNRLTEVIEIWEDWSQHPKLKVYQLKLQNLDYELQLQKNNALPNIGIKYNFLAANHVNFFRTYNGYAPIGNYKLGMDITVPILNRKNRATRQFVQLDYEATELELQSEQRTLTTQGQNYAEQIRSYQEQTNWAKQLMDNYQNIFLNERLKYQLGESTMLVVNTRKQQFVQAQLKYLALRYKYIKALLAYAKLSLQYGKF